MKGALEKRLDELWGCVVMKYEMNIFEDRLKFDLRCNEEGGYTDFEVIFEEIKSVFYVHEPNDEEWEKRNEPQDSNQTDDEDDFLFLGFEEIYYEAREVRDRVSVATIQDETEVDSFYAKPNFTIHLNGYGTLMPITAKSITINGEKFDNLI